MGSISQNGFVSKTMGCSQHLPDRCASRTSIRPAMEWPPLPTAPSLAMGGRDSERLVKAVYISRAFTRDDRKGFGAEPKGAPRSLRVKVKLSSSTPASLHSFFNTHVSGWEHSLSLSLICLGQQKAQKTPGNRDTKHLQYQKMWKLCTCHLRSVGCNNLETGRSTVSHTKIPVELIENPSESGAMRTTMLSNMP